MAEVTNGLQQVNTYGTRCLMQNGFINNLMLQFLIIFI